MADIVGQADRVSEMKMFLSLSLFLLLFPPLLLLFLLFSFSSLLSFFIALRLKHQKNPPKGTCFVLHPLLMTSYHF